MIGLLELAAAILLTAALILILKGLSQSVGSAPRRG
jgi:hypothetical protein